MYPEYVLRMNMLKNLPAESDSAKALMHKHGDIVIGECLAIVEQNSQHIISPTDVLDEG